MIGLAMWLMRGMDEFSRDHRRFKRYCKAQAHEFNKMMNLADDIFTEEMVLAV